VRESGVGAGFAGNRLPAGDDPNPERICPGRAKRAGFAAALRHVALGGLDELRELGLVGE
jgi:hypothetical protein